MIIYGAGEIMEISKNNMIFLAEETNISLSHINTYYDILSRIPCVYDGKKSQLLNCLYSLIILRKNNPCNFNSEEFKFMLSEALLGTYKEEALPYVNLYFMDSREKQMTRTLTKQKPQ